MEDVINLWKNKHITCWESVLLLHQRHKIPINESIEIMNIQMDKYIEDLEKESNLLDQLNIGLKKELD